MQGHGFVQNSVACLGGQGTPPQHQVGKKENPVLGCVERIESSSRASHDVLLENQSESFLDVS